MCKPRQTYACNRFRDERRRGRVLSGSFATEDTEHTETGTKHPQGFYPYPFPPPSVSVSFVSSVVNILTDGRTRATRASVPVAYGKMQPVPL